MKNDITFPARIGLFLWLVALIFISWKALVEPGTNTVVYHYLAGGERWLAREDLYNGPHGFIYMPLFAWFFSCFAQLPALAVDIIWRLAQVGLLFYALYSIGRVICEENHQREKLWQWFGLMSLVAVPIAFSGLRNGQMNVILSAAMVLVTSQLIEQRWNLAALVLALVMSLKPTFAVFFLLAVALYRPLWWRVIPMMVVFLALPLLFGGMDYGIAQYHNFIDMGRSAMKLGMMEPNWATFFNIAPQVFDFYVPDSVQLAVKIPLASLTLWLCWVILRNSDKATGAVFMLSLACCYHMLFNPRSVNTDYIILGSAIAVWFACAICFWKEKTLAWLTGLNGLLILEAYEISLLITPDHHSWVNPVAALLFTIFVVWQFRQQRRFV